MEYRINKIVEDSRSGDKKAVEMLLFEVKPMILKAVSRWGLDFYRREDLLQQGYLITLECLKKYEPNKNVPFVSYLKCAISRGIRRYSTCRETACLNEKVYDDVEMIDLQADSGVDLEEALICSDEKSRFRTALNGLKDEDKDLIVMKYWQGYTLKYIAEIKGSSYMSMVRLHQRLLHKMKHMICR